MTLVLEYSDARRSENLARIRRAVVLRAMVATGMSQRQIASGLGISQPAVSQQIRHAPDLDSVHPEALIEAAGPVLRTVAAERNYSQLGVFGSVARGQAREDSDIDLIVQPPEGTSSFDFIRFKQLIETILGREVDLISYDGLTPGLDDDIRRDLVLL